MFNVSRFTDAGGILKGESDISGATEALDEVAAGVESRDPPVVPQALHKEMIRKAAQVSIFIVSLLFFPADRNVRLKMLRRRHGQY
jgi:hypothetical protein